MEPAELLDLLDHVQDVVSRYRLLPEPAMEYVNAPVERLLGYTPDEIYAEPDLLTLAVHPDDWDALQPFGQPGSTAPVEPVAVRLRRKDGTFVWTELVNVPLRDENGVVVAVVGVAREITDRLAAERDRRELEVARVREAKALEINDDVVQHLVTAKLLLDLGRHDEAADALTRGLEAARGIINDLLGAHEGVELVLGALRRQAASGDAR
jgi:PAS domain S-box-containing protein